MPLVEVTEVIAAPVDRVWEVVNDVASYPRLIAHVRSLVDETIQVTEQEIGDAVRFLARHTKLLAEPSGVVSVAGARRLAPAGSRGVHVAVVSGGNAEIQRIVELLAEGSQAAR